MSKILVNNPTEYERTETVIFGCPLDVDVGEQLKKLPEYQLRVARIKVPPMISGYMDLVHIPRDDHISLDEKHIAKSFQNALKSCATGEGFDKIKTLEKNSLMEVVLYHSHTKKTHQHLIAYFGKNEPWVKYELLETGDLYSPDANVKVGIFSEDTNWTHTNYIIPDDNSGIGLGETVKIRDMAGVATVGCFINITEALKTQEDILTGLAMKEIELVVGGDYRLAWGPNKVVPHGYHIDRNYNKNILAHRGCLCNEMPSNTGEQKGFGYWKHLDVISQGRGNLLWHDRYATIQEARRFYFLFEPDGRVPLPEDHPNFKSWSETFHWAVFQSPDSFGRRERYKGHGWYDGWGSYDYQHYSAVMLKEQQMLVGSFMLRMIADMRIFHFLKQISYPTAGRALGRNIRGGIDLYLATGDERVLDKLEEVAKLLISNFDNTNGSGSSENLVEYPTVLRLYNDDPHTQIPGLEWIVWEDAIALPTIYWLGKLVGEPKLMLIAMNLGKTILQYGFKDKRVLKAIKWNGPGKTLGPLFATSNQTNYTEWSLPALTMTSILAGEFGDIQTEKDAAEIALHIRDTSNYDNLSSYDIV